MFELLVQMFLNLKCNGMIEANLEDIYLHLERIDIHGPQPSTPV